MSSVTSKWPWPEFCCLYSWSIYHKLISCLVKSRRCLKSSYIRAMAQFCLSIATNNVKTVGERQPPFFLFFTSEEVKGFSEHCLVQENRWRTLKEICPAESKCLTIAVFNEVLLSESRVAVKGSNYSPPSCHLIVSRVFEKREVNLQLRFSTDKSSDFFNFL